MKTTTFKLSAANSWKLPATLSPTLDSENTLVVVFGGSNLTNDCPGLTALFQAFPKAHMLGCSTSGEILGGEVVDGSLSVAVSRFESTTLRMATSRLDRQVDSLAAGRELGERLKGPGLKAVFVLSDGLAVNGTQLVAGMNGVLPKDVIVTGGLAGDGDKFKHTWVLSGHSLGDKAVTAVGLYGDKVVIRHGSQGGWDGFGPERLITKSESNVLYELNGKSALDVYKEYLGSLASGLPGAALFYPLSLRRGSAPDDYVIRTVLSVDEAKKSLTFAGDMPEGGRVQLMRGSFDDLIEGAGEAARQTGSKGQSQGETLSIAVSCVGRRLVFGQRTEEELESVLEALAPATQMVGFYSYGELSPLGAGQCELHNQTMAVTTIEERS